MNRHLASKLLHYGIVLALLLGLLVLPGTTRAQQGAPDPGGPDKGPVPELQTIAPGAIPIQGRLYDALGKPLTGTYSMVFSLYEEEAAATALCSDMRSVTVKNGLFSDLIDHCYDNLSGQKVWLGVKVGSDAEMTPRQPILAVPYALGLVPGSSIVTTKVAALSLTTSAAGGKALSANASAATGASYAVYAYSASPDGSAGYFYNNSAGPGLQGISLAGDGIYAGSLGGNAIRANSGAFAALALEGTGRLTSTAKSYLWISGNGVRPYKMSDTTVVDMDTVGGARITRGSVISNKNVMLPITIPGDLYGQAVRVTAADLYWSGDTAFDVVSAVLIRRQKGVCETSACYDTLLHDPTDYVCEDGTNPTGCTQHFALTANNTITATSGILYMTIELAFNSDTSWVRIGGVRLTLEHVD